MNVEDEFLDVLQDIETAIVGVYHDRPALLDIDVLEALDGLIRASTWEKDRRGTPSLRLSDRSQAVYDRCRRVCEWRLGRQSLEPDEPEKMKTREGDITLEQALACLKRIRSSVRFWTKEGGRRGYLNYVRQFLGEDTQGLDLQT